ncbi:MAG: cytochrome P460 family protein [Bradymonadaceae bacterium]
MPSPKFIVLTLPFLLLLPTVSACGGDDDSSAEPNEETRAIFQEIENYKSWSHLGGNDTKTLSGDHAGMYVVTYHNAVVQDAIDNHTLPLPAGAIIVKESYASESDLDPTALSIMSKTSAAQGDWYWVQATGDQRVMVDGGAPLEGRDVAMCSGCHNAGAAHNDFVFLHDFAPAENE